MIGKAAGVDSFISDLSTVNNQPDYRICVNVSGEGHHFAILVYYPPNLLVSLAFGLFPRQQDYLLFSCLYFLSISIAFLFDLCFQLPLLAI